MGFKYKKRAQIGKSLKVLMFEWMVQQIEPQYKLLHARLMPGGVSARVSALEVQRASGQIETWVVRQYGEIDRRENPQIAGLEFRVLQIAQAVGLAVPAPYGLDQSGAVLSTPCIVIEYIDGRPEFAPAHLTDYLLQLATYLAKLHTVDSSAFDLSFLPHQDSRCAARLAQRPTAVDDELGEGRVRDMLQAVWPLAQRNRAVLLHGDFWPGNILWREGQIAAVIDWEDAAVGDPLADLANTRLELLWAFGFEAMQQFTQLYQNLTRIDVAHLPYWDLCAALRPIGKLDQWGLDEEVHHRMRARLRLFIDQALKTLVAHRVDVDS